MKRILVLVFILSFLSMRVMRYFDLAKWQVSLGLLAVGIVLYVGNAFLMQYFIKKRAPEFASDEEVAPGVLAWELTAGLGIVPKWVSFLGLLGLSAIISAVVPWLIGLFAGK